MPRLQAGQGRAKVRGPGQPCTRVRVRPGERGSGPERCQEGPCCPDECPRRPEPPRPAAGRPAHLGLARVPSPPRVSPPCPALTWVGASACADAAHADRGRGPGRGSRAGIRLTVDEEDERSVCPAPRWPPRRPAATSATRPDTPLGRPPPGRPTPTQNWPGCTAAHVVLSPPPSQRDNDQSFPRG